MALSPIEDRYLSALTAAQFPDMPASEPAMPVEPGAMESSVDGMVLAAGPSQTRSDAGGGMGEIKPIPRNKAQEALGFVGELLTKAGVQLDQYGLDVPGLGRITLKDLTVGEAGKVLEDMSYGFMPVRGGNVATGGIGTFGLKPDASMELLNVAPAAGAVAKAGVKAGVKGAMAVGRAGERIAEKTVPQIMKKGGTLAELLQALSQGSRSQLTAYHGTPHRVDQFDSKKIGSGEGAQAYGYGLYFAEAKDVANQYRINLSYNPDEMKIGGKQINDVYKTIERGATRMSPDKAQAEYEKLDVLERLMMNEMPADLADYVADLAPETQQWFNKTVKPSFQTYGNLYTVDIPDAMVAKMLDFDAPLGEQSPEIQALAKQYNLSLSDLGGDLLAAANGKTAAGAQKLREAGVLGVRYLDQGSRSSKASTRNIVVFPGGEDQIKILKQEGKK